MLKIALPNKGALSTDAVSLVTEAGYNAKRGERELRAIDTTNEIEFLFLRPRDIAIYVANGIVDAGITGRDLLMDSQANAVELMALGFGKSRFFYAAPNDSPLLPETLNGRRIATSYPNIVRADMARRGFEASIVKLDGAVEISISLGVADAIADVVESGSTMRNAGLKTIGDPIMESEALVIGRDAMVAAQPGVRTFLRRIEGIIVARNYVMVEFDIRKDNLEAACRIAPGVEAPTVAPLSKDGWFAVKSMIKRKTLNQVIDDLEAIGANGIIVSNLVTCRI